MQTDSVSPRARASDAAAAHQQGHVAIKLPSVQAANAQPAAASETAGRRLPRFTTVVPSLRSRLISRLSSAKTTLVAYTRAIATAGRQLARAILEVENQTTDKVKLEIFYRQTCADHYHMPPPPTADPSNSLRHVMHPMDTQLAIELAITLS